LRVQTSTATSQAPWNSNTEINPPFNGSLTDSAEIASSVRAAGSMGPASLQSLEPTNVILQRSATNELVSHTRVSDYEIEGKIGEGAMGAVYRAVHPTIGKHVAVKIMNAKLCDDLGAIERFTREARSVAAIRHPGIVDVFGFGTLQDGRAYLIMEWLDGISLGARLEHGQFTQDEALDVLDQIARALEAAHDKGITHRDLKPDNVFLQRVARERPVVKLLDFGLAKLADEDGRIARTQTGQLLGTPVYMSPEQCRAKGVDHRTDIYALGCIAYALICGRVPFNADNTAELIAAHLSELPPIPRSLFPAIPPQLDGLLFAMLAKDPARRPTLQQIRRTIATVRSSVYPTPVPDRPMLAKRVHPRRNVLVALVALAALGIGVGVAIFVLQSNDVPSAVPDIGSAFDANNVEPVVEPVADANMAAADVVPSVRDTVEKPAIKPAVKPAIKKPVTVEKHVIENKPDPNTTTLNPFHKKKLNP
jgi:serine/threonine protein kinase